MFFFSINKSFRPIRVSLLPVQILILNLALFLLDDNLCCEVFLSLGGQSVGAGTGIKTGFVAARLRGLRHCGERGYGELCEFLLVKVVDRLASPLCVLVCDDDCGVFSVRDGCNCGELVGILILFFLGGGGGGVKDVDGTVVVDVGCFWLGRFS